MIPEPWPIPPVRTPLGMEASLLGSDVQELFRTEGFGSLRTDVQYAVSTACLTEFLCVVGLFELNFLALPVAAVGRGGDPSGAAHLSDFYGDWMFGSCSAVMAQSPSKQISVRN